MAAAPQIPTFQLAAGGAGDLADVMRVMNSAFSPSFGEGWSQSQCAGILPLAGVRLIPTASLPDFTWSAALPTRPNCCCSP